MDHYKGYSEKGFEQLLKTLAGIQGKFLVSSYPSDILDKYSKKHKWHTLEKSAEVSVTHQTDEVKTEMFTSNCSLKNELNGLENISLRAKALKLQILISEV